MKKRTKPPEYKDSFHFRLFPDYTYTRAQNLRFRLFQGRIEHWRAAVNYADQFREPNRINLLYLLGYRPGIRKYVEKTQSNLVILCANIQPEQLKAYDAYWSLMEKFKGIYADAGGTLLPCYYKERETEKAYRGTGIFSSELYELHDAEDRIIADYERLKMEIRSCFERYTCIRRGSPEKTASHEDLDRIIRQYFLYGREQCAVLKRNFTSIKGIENALKSGLRRENAPKLLDLPQGADCFTACKRSIRRCQMALNTALRNDGAINLSNLFEQMKHPPYGWSTDSHAAYCFGYAVSGCLDNTWSWDTVNCFPSQESIYSVLRSIVFGTAKRWCSYTLVSENGFRLASRFAYMFGIDTGDYLPRDAIDKQILALHRAGCTERKIADELGTMTNVAVHKRLARMRKTPEAPVPFCVMANTICMEIEGRTRWPVALIDSQLHSALCGDWDYEQNVSIPIFGKARVREALSYFTLERCRILKEKLDAINSLIPAMIRERYGAETDTDALMESYTTRSSGWLWDAEIFWETSEKYVAKTNRKDKSENIQPEQLANTPLPL